MLAPPEARVMRYFRLWGSRNKGPAEGACEKREEQTYREKQIQTPRSPRKETERLPINFLGLARPSSLATVA